MWRLINTLLYGLYYRLRGFRQAHRGRTAARDATIISSESGETPILYVAWGRIGDMVLATGHLQHLRQVFQPHPIWLLGRPETEAVVKPHVDVFIPLKEEAWLSDREVQVTLYRSLAQRFASIIADIHTFYGGVFVLGPLLERLQAERKFIYEGYVLSGNLAAWRRYPAGFEVVSKLADHPGNGNPWPRRHVLDHTAYYLNTVLERLGKPAIPVEEMRPALVSTGDSEGVCRTFGLSPGGFIAWQPASNNRKKDYPMERWFEVIAAFPDQLFVALGTRQEQGKLRGFSAPNLRDLCGQTSLAQTIQLIRAARLYVGLDSGLSHIASVSGQTTVCLTQDSNLGYFFPYPPEYGFTNQHTVYHPDYVACSGCFMTCRHESIVATYRRGSLCLRELPVSEVVAAIKKQIGK